MNSNKYTIDRFEGELAVLLLRKNERIERIVPKTVLGDVLEGDILFVTFDDKGNVVKSLVLKDETEQGWKDAEELLKQIKKTNG